MVRSMTGYGRAETQLADKQIVVEIRSVNHRFLDISVRMPRLFATLEKDIRKQISAAAQRGKIDVSVQCEASQVGEAPLSVDSAALGHVRALLRQVQELSGADGPLDLQTLLVFKDMLFRHTDEPADEKQVWAVLQPCLVQALDAMSRMQEAEGGEIARDIQGRLAHVAQLKDAIADRAPDALQARREALRQRIAALCEGIDLDESRMTQEIALMADKSDVTEELVRAGSHIGQFLNGLEACEPVGRKLDFLIQEINREINTIGSKASDAHIALQVVEAKNELEKIREQVQNIM
jgi:uncharacterized protein (TIGR00255 family)